jgi:3-hydroxyanthranilate 3,4-dioxygenase
MLPPINLKKWIDENKQDLQPPVGNKMIYNDGEFKVMVVAGPNERSDYHVEAGPEWFYQIQGPMVLKIVDPANGEFRDVRIEEGDMFMLPGNVPHSPQRFANTLGLVIERERRHDETEDMLRWYCEKCHEIVFQDQFYCHDLGLQLKPVIARWRSDEALRTCSKCGHVNPPK